MKVLVISHMYPSSFNEVGGIFVHEQVKALAAKGVEIQVVSPVPWTPFPINYLTSKWKNYSAIPERSIWEGITVWYPRYVTFPRAWFFASSGQRMYLGIKELVAKIYQKFKFDLIHTHVALPDGYAGMKIAQKYKKPLIVNIHGQDFQQTIFKSKKCKKNIEKVINYSTKTIAVSKKLKKVGEKYLEVNKDKIIVVPNGINMEVNKDKIIVVPNGINMRDIYTGKNKNIQEYNGKKVILSVSHLIKTKGIDLNLKAIDKLKQKYPDIIYLIIGKGKEKKDLKKLVNKLNLQNMVIFIGEVSHYEVMEYMASCDIFSLPSWNEGFGVVYIEAMAQGKPVIGCQGEGIEDFVEHGITGMLVKPKDVDSLVGALDFLLSRPSEAQDIGKRARGLVLKKYTWEKNAEKTIEVYREVFNNAR